MQPDGDSPNQGSEPGPNDKARQEAGASKMGMAAWCFYDWANSAFPTIIGTFVFATYFASAVAPDEKTGFSIWSTAVAVSGFAIAILAPILGSIADQGGRRLPWLGVLTAILAIASAGLWFVEPDPSFIVLGIILFVIATVAFEFGQVFYNAMLGDIAPPHMLGRLSGWAWGLGYFGGIFALLICLFGFIQTDIPPFGLDKEAAEHVRAVGPLVGLWIAIFSIPVFVVLREPSRPHAPPPLQAVRKGLLTLGRTLKSLPKRKNLFTFLIARMIYTDGLNTLFALGGVFAATAMGMETADVIIFGIALNVTAGLGAVLFGFLDDRLGAKPVILISVGGLSVFAIPLLFTTNVTIFWTFALIIGIFMGPAQAASRTLMTKLSPPELRTEYFGLYALSGKATSFVGPLAVSMITVMADSQRVGMSVILAFFIVGLVLLLLVKEPGREPTGGTATSSASP